MHLRHKRAGLLKLGREGSTPQSQDARGIHDLEEQLFCLVALATTPRGRENNEQTV